VEKEVSLFLIRSCWIHRAAYRAWTMANTDSVLCTREVYAVLQSLWNTTTAPQWQFRLYTVRTQINLLT